ncbi:hypothetical protein RIF29_27640 [Crotalaria pallida]|uniref:Homeobox domain-containing protein n=1 Tax=Crotalaria pallida TaxID=3830 RepID=A0AAN9ERT5_CROPI
MLHEPAAAVYSSSEMANFSNPFSAPRNNNTTVYGELGAAAEPVKLMMHHQHGSFPYTSTSLGNWRNSAATNQGVDWNIANYASSSMASESNQITFSASELNNNVSVYQHYGKPSYNEITDSQSCSLSREIQNQLGVNVMHHTQNALQDIVKSASISARNGSESNQNICVGDGASSELEQLQVQPTYANQQNHRSRFAIGSWTSITPLGFTGKSDSNPQSLSLSLSSNSPSKPSVSHFEEGSAACASDHGISKDPEYVKSFVKPSIISRDCGKSLHNNNSSSYGKVGPLGPFTGYATILKSSRFLNSAQQLLDEFCCDVSKKVSGEVSASTSASASAVVTVNETRGVVALKGGNNSGSSSSVLHSANVNSTDYQQKKAKLLYMQEEVARRCKQYHQQMQMVVSSFESVAGLGSATPYVSLALKSVSRHFKCLKNTISDQLRLVCEVLGEDLSIPTASTSIKIDTIAANPRCMDQSFQKNKAGRSNTGPHEHQHHVWKPQRGLPEPAVAILKAWLFEHFLHPYPTDNDKHMLASQTGLSRNQVSNWFINARVRVWKPMVEEIHTLETKGATGDDDDNKNNNSSKNDETSSCNEVGSTSLQPRVDDKPLTLSKFGMLHSIPENQFQCMEMSTASIACCNNNDSEGKGLNYEEQWSQEKRSKLEFLQVSNNSSMDGTLMGFVPYQQHGGIEVGGLGSVSLTLGLRHGVEGGSVQNQQQLQEEQFIRHYGGHIHDFVG